MSPSAKKLLEQALELSEESRAELAAALVESIEEAADSPQDVVDASWSATIERRIREIESGAVEPIPWEDARKIIFGDGTPDR